MKHARTAPLLLAASALLGACSRGDSASSALDAHLASEHIADMAVEASLPQGYGVATWFDVWKEVEPIARKRDASAREKLLGALVLLELPNVGLEKLGMDDSQKFHEAERLLREAEKETPDDPAVHYNLGRVVLELNGIGEIDWFDANERASKHYRRALDLAPEDYPSKFALAKTLDDLEELEAATELWRELVDVGFARAGRWHMTSLYRLSQSLNAAELREEALRLNEEMQVLAARGVKAYGGDSAMVLKRGNLGRIARPPVLPASVAEPAALRALPEPRARRSVPEGYEHLELVDLWFLPPKTKEEIDEEKAAAAASNDGTPRTHAREKALTYPGPSAIAMWGPAGARVVSLGGPEFDLVVTELPVDLLEPLDLDIDGDLDFIAVRGKELVFLRQDARTWAPYAVPTPELPGPPTDLVAVDYDHEKDLDLVAVGPFGVRVLRNDGAGIQLVDANNVPLGREGSFTDATSTTGIPADVPFAWVVTEDYDTDQDVEFLFGGAGRALLASSAREGRFVDESAGLPAALATSARPLVADLDGDSRPDLAVPGADGKLTIHTGSADLRFTEQSSWASPASTLAAFDLDLDGATDVLVGDGGAFRARLAAGLPVAVDSEVRGPSGAFVALGDLNGDLAPELVTLESGELVARALPVVAKPLVLALRGEHDNRFAIGTVVEVRSGPIYRRIYWRGVPETIGLDGRAQIDTLRFTWPNGVVHHLFDVEGGRSLFVQQKPGEVGSCPFLYTWNGTKWEYITDVLGVTPLGLPMGPGMLVPPDHDEYVLVRGDQLAPRALDDGSLVYELAMTEELREVTYLDRAWLEVVDHPAGTEIYPDERFTFPPFPEPHTHTVRAPLAPLSATDPSGRDWTSELAAWDDSYAVPFEVENWPYMGIARPHWVELSFDPDSVRDAEKLRLLATGWFLWTNASVNMQIARTPGVDFVPPILQVPDGEGGWRDAGPPVGFPAGKTKTMVIDVSDVLDRADPRMRLFTTLAIYWDALRLAVDGDDAALEVHHLEATYANLWERGFSAPIPRGEDPWLEWFEWDRLEPVPRWNQHPGVYTRFGDVLPLLDEIDDRFVILGAGDALTLRFDAGAVPPLEDGMVRDYLVFFDGWAKDRDPNSIDVLFVEPLPFHGMSGYPYGPDERFPDTEEHRAWRREWNTRPAKRWIEPLAREIDPPILRGTAFAGGGLGSGEGTDG